MQLMQTVSKSNPSVPYPIGVDIYQTNLLFVKIMSHINKNKAELSQSSNLVVLVADLNHSCSLLQ